MDINKLILKIIRGKRPRIANKTLKANDKVGALTLSNFKIYGKAIIKTVGHIGKGIDK